MRYNKQLSCIIIDCEATSIETLTEIIDSLPYLKLIKAYSDPVTAIKEISLSNTPIDFLFMDIKMPKLSGLEVASIIRHKVDKLIFTTASAKYSLAAYDVLCNHYMLKPFTQQKFVEIINKLIEQPKQESIGASESIFIKSANNGKYLRVKYDDIICINALEHYIVVHTVSDQYMQHTSMKEVEYLLRGNPNFIRVHKSHIVSKNHILSVCRNIIVLTNNLEIVIGATFKQSFNDFLNSNSLS